MKKAGIINTSRHKFPGDKASVLVVPGEQLIDILTNLDRHYPGVAQLIKASADTTTRLLGGDTSLAQEVHEIRQAQEQLPANHPARAFGEAVESGRVGNLPAIKFIRGTGLA